MPTFKLGPLANETLMDAISKELPQSSFYLLLISLVMAIAWIVYLTYYNSRVFGLILTTVLNRFIKMGHVSIGELTVFYTNTCTQFGSL